MKELKFIFENKEVKIEVINGQTMFEIYSTGMALGQVKKNIVKGKEYYQCRKDRVNENIKNAEINPLVHNGLNYISESQLYDLMLEMKTDKVKPFRKWVTLEVLPTINKTGGYIEYNQEERFVESYFPLLSDDTKKTIIVELKKKNEELQEFYNDLMNTNGLMDMDTVAKELDIGEYTLFAYLRGKKIFFYNSDNVNIPFERFRKEKKFEVKKTPCRDGKYRDVTYATNKGLEYIRKQLHKDNYYTEVHA